MNFAAGVIAVVGVLVAVSIGFIVMSPDDVIQPRAVQEQLSKCDNGMSPVCGIDGQTYANECALEDANVKMVHMGECSVDNPLVKPRVESTPVVVEEVIEEPVVEIAEETIVEEPQVVEEIVEQVEEIIETVSMRVAPQTHLVEIPEGTGFPGCEETNECYIPYELEIHVGDTIQWDNQDSASHTVTSGSMSAGVTGVFDSSLFMPGELFEHTFDEAGTFDYFCMVHPWMTGKIIVNEVQADTSVEMVEDLEPEVTEEVEVVEDVIEEPVEIIEEPVIEVEEIAPLPMSMTVNVAEGSGAPGCDETLECYLPYTAEIAVGGTITWSNIDVAAHTVTSGSMADGVNGLFDSGLFMAGSTFEHTFDEAGTFDYFCMVHPWMTGVISVS